MKTFYRFLAILPGLFLTLSLAASGYVAPPSLKLHVVICSRAYWDGPSKSCIPREKGGCCHIWTSGMVPGPGEIEGDLVPAGGRSFQMIISRNSGMKKEVWDQYFSGGKFLLDGPLTFEPEVLNRLGTERNYSVPPGSYPYSVNGDTVTITFR